MRACSFCLILIVTVLSSACTWRSPAQKIPRPFAVGFTQSIDQLNPFSQSGTDFWWLQSLLFESLLRRDPLTYELKPALAKGYQWSEDSKAIVFELRSELYWSDGEPITAEDIQFSIEVHSQPEYKSIYQGVYEKIIEKVEIISARRMKIHFFQPSQNNLNTVAFNLKIYPKHFYGDRSQRHQWNHSMVNSGPYKVDDFQSGKFIQIRKNSQWYGSKVKELEDWFPMPQIRFEMASGEGILYEWLEAGKVDYFRVTRPLLFKKLSKKMQKKSQVRSVKAEGFRLLGRRAILINHKNPALQDLRVRKALIHAFDREEVNQKLYGNLLRPAAGPWNQNHPAADLSIRPLSYNLAKARQLLNETGWRDLDKDGIREKKVNGEIKNLVIHFLEYNSDNKPLLTLYQQAVRRIGVDVKIVVRGFIEVMRMFESSEFDAAHTYSLWGYPELDLRSWYHSENSDNPWSNIGHFHSEKMDRLIEKIENTKDPMERKGLYQRAYGLLASQLPDLYWFEDKYFLYFVSERVKRPQDILPYSLGLHTWSLEDGHN